MANETVLFKRGDSATITSTPVTDGQILFDTSGNGKMYLDNGTDRLEMGGAITVDASLSKTSTNAIQNKAVTGNILNSLAEVSAATQQNTIAGALALKEVNSSLNGLSFDKDADGKWGYKVGADPVIPFSSFNYYTEQLVTASGQSYQVDCGFDVKFAFTRNYSNTITDLYADNSNTHYTDTPCSLQKVEGNIITIKGNAGNLSKFQRTITLYALG